MKVIRIFADKLYELYLKFCRKKGKKAGNLKVEKELSGLNPGIRREELLKDYYKGKLVKTVLIIAAIILFMLLSVAASYKNRVIKDGNILTRNGYGEGSYKVDLIAEAEESRQSLEIEVEEQQYTEEEVIDLMNELSSKLEDIIKGENDSLNYVTQKLSLTNKAEGYPFILSWESENYALLKNNGTLDETKLTEKGEEVGLKCTMTYGEVKRDFYYRVTLYEKPLTEDEIYKNEIITSIREASENTKYVPYVSLPETGSKGYISWSEAGDPMLAVLAVLSGITPLAVWVGMDKDLADRYRKRNQSLYLDYPEFVSKLQLLVSSGMTLRGALMRMGDDYKNKLGEGGSRQYVYEELLICNRQMRDGVGEIQCYEAFGNRCALMPYRKLAALLIQNLKKGNNSLVNALALESSLAFEERKNSAKRLGEEAQTKLLMPMMLMLMVVMVIIMIPAYVNFGS